jgi:hypothetical protein
MYYSGELSRPSILKPTESIFWCFLQQRILRFVSDYLPLEVRTAHTPVHIGSPSTQAESDQYQAAMKNFIDAAIRDSTPPGIMQHLGAVEIIQDWDLMRAAFGYDKVSFTGVS